jgi:hypothetical protein
MWATVKLIAAFAISLASVVVFIISLCAIGQGWLPIVGLIASEAWIIGYILREEK